MERYTASGKQVLCDRLHFADASTNDAANKIALALNIIDPCDDPDERQQTLWPAPSGSHHVRQENDEYACSCGRRWDAREGDEHP